MKSVFQLVIIIYLSQLTFLAYCQSDQIRPQVWSNLAVGWNVSDKFVLRGAASYNVLLSSEAPWNEITASASAVFKFHRFMEANAGLYVAAAQQNESLRSFEYRPYVGFRIFTNDEKRWYLTNLTRFETRIFRYSDRTTELGYRLRNRTYIAASILKPSMSDNKNLYIYGYFEAFYNFEDEVKERFFNQFKYKIGLGYRLSDNWRFDLGFLYQDSKNTAGEPSQLPVYIDTNWIVEWGIAYIIPVKKKN